MVGFGGSTNSGGTVSSGGAPIVGCPGQPVTQPTMTTGLATCPSPPRTTSEITPGVFVDILETFAAAGCTYPAPSPIPLNVNNTGSDYTDPNNLSVIIQPNNQSPEILPNVSDATDCDDRSGGWYFDSNSNPTTVTLCACNCTRVNVLQGKVYMVGFPIVCVVP
jgi:hypothetical protein